MFSHGVLHESSRKTSFDDLGIQKCGQDEFEADPPRVADALDLEIDKR